MVSAQLLSRNILLESLQIQNNSISQIEKGFYKPLTNLTRADFSSNICISESIILTKFIKWNSQLLKFKDCFNNYALMKPTNEELNSVRSKMDNLDTKVAEAVERVDNDLKVLENKMENNTDLQKYKTNLVNFFKKDKEQLEKNYEENLTNITSAVKTDLMDEIKKNVVEVLEKSQKVEQAKLVTDDFASLREEFSGKLTLVYWTLFFIICFACIAGFFVLKGQSLYPIFYRSHGDDSKLIEAEVC